MFYVKTKQNDNVFSVYDVKNDSSGYPHFLIYDKKQWRWVSAKIFQPPADVVEVVRCKNCRKVMEVKIDDSVRSFLR